jgi:hypothetical protein
MLTNKERNILKECGQEYLRELVLDSKVIKEQTTFLEHVKLFSYIDKLSYTDIIKLTITEDVTAFEGKFKKFLKYSFAAIAGSSFFGLAPPISMFALYIYRKLNDSCEKKCYANIPFSKKRKICKYQCQLDIARKITDDLRSDIGKCDDFRNPDKCERSLRKEYMKWAKRVQQLQIKLRQSQLDNREKPEFKGSARYRVESIIRKFNISNEEISTFIKENKELRNKLPFRNHLKLYYEFAVLKKNEAIVEPPKRDPRKEKILNTILTIGMVPIPIPMAMVVMNYLLNKVNFSCLSKCLNQSKYPKNVCYAQCDWLSIRMVVNELEKQLTKCEKVEEKTKCKQKVLKLLEDWKQKEVESKIKFDSELRIAYKKLQKEKQDRDREKEKQ